MERIEKSSPSSCLTHLKICDYHELNFTMEPNDDLETSARCA
jgi:hypothetical protein